MSAAKFGAQLMALPEIFSNHYFVIPDYQRGYAWEKEQVGDMLADIEHLISDEQAIRHYTGTLVLSRPEDLLLDELHVVDGQQRLTTLVILMHCLLKYLPEDQQEICKNLYVMRGDIGSERHVLTANTDARHFFEKVILGNVILSNNPVTIRAHQRLYDAKKQINSWIEEVASKNITANAIKDAVELKMGFLAYSPVEDAETGIMFEVINNRGKDLSELEKVKNYLIYCSVKLGAKTLRLEIDTCWSAILKSLNIAKINSRAEEGSFLRYCSAVFFNLSKDNSRYSYDQIKLKLNISAAIKDKDEKLSVIKRIQLFVAFVNDAALWCARLYGQAHDGLNQRMIYILELLRAQNSDASIMPLFFALVIKYGKEDERVIRLLGLVEKLNFRVYTALGVVARSDSGQGDLYWWASLFYHGSLLASIPDEQRSVGGVNLTNDFDALESNLVSFISKHSPESIFEKSFYLNEDSQFDFYNWGGLRYFLMCYEEKIQLYKTINIDTITKSRSEGKSGDYLSVEHIWAIENRNGRDENSRKIDFHEKRRLGNFVLLELRLNIKGGNKDIEEKLAIYLSGIDEETPTVLKQVILLNNSFKFVQSDLFSLEKNNEYFYDLHRLINDEQEKRYTNFAMERWSIRDYLGYSVPTDNILLEGNA